MDFVVSIGIFFITAETGIGMMDFKALLHHFGIIENTIIDKSTVDPLPPSSTTFFALNYRG